MKKFKPTYLILSLTALLMITSCGKNDLTPSLPDSEVISSPISFDQTASKLAEILLIANENNWFDQSDLITSLLKPDRSFTPAEINAIETNLGISYNDFNRLISELGSAVYEYVNALTALNLTNEELSSIIHDDVSSSAELEFLRSSIVNAQGRCFLQDACYLIGGIIVEAYLILCNLFTDIFCEEEVLPLIILVGEICELFAC